MTRRRTTNYKQLSDYKKICFLYFCYPPFLRDLNRAFVHIELFKKVCKNDRIVYSYIPDFLGKYSFQNLICLKIILDFLTDGRPFPLYSEIKIKSMNPKSRNSSDRFIYECYVYGLRQKSKLEALLKKYPKLKKSFRLTVKQFESVKGLSLYDPANYPNIPKEWEDYEPQRANKFIKKIHHSFINRLIIIGEKKSGFKKAFNKLAKEYGNK